MDFDWDDANLEHIARHNVEDFEVEEVFFDPVRKRDNAYSKSGEQRRALIGMTEDGRILYVVYTKRRGKIRPLMARDVSSAEKARYRRRR